MTREVMLDEEEYPLIDEFQEAREEGRQPVCISCNEPIETIRQHQNEYIDWNWDEEKKRFVKAPETGHAEKPYCLNCNYEDWDFLDQNSEVDMGVDF